MGEDTVWTTLPGPTGPVAIAVSPRGLRRLSLLDRPERAAEHMPDGAVEGENERTAAVAAQLAAYLTGERREFDLPLDWSDFDGWQRTVLQTLHETVAYGETVSYGELAARAGRPGAARVVGAIMGSNPIPIVVPCHRVVDSGGGLGGFSGSRRGPSMETKRRLLTIEGAIAPTLF
ncbi:methylated-DNA--protein-cysteine methyltransferase [Actinorhabdospora filicis]|uniref:methylated-DNA--[protein]-cysteine S-methyltransferase n=1 Tax=Actinorhabdospora filicis TaxID=1785913 RepID=A0A9W6SLT2_9ACTN|nr:methylated-DNA--[protein]-cysteine S-methyltransferase [Actinorhabdospora filicis]GLZ79304.1 methylated-DNA--protein-cysteine methyltransferase [Actinorhabdospora filicis]